VGGLEPLRAWLRARLFQTNYRPVPLTQHLISERAVYKCTEPFQRHQGTKEATHLGENEIKGKNCDTSDNEGLELMRRLPQSPDARRDPDSIAPLVAEGTALNHPVLVFCASRAACEACSRMLADLLPEASGLVVGAEGEEAHRYKAREAEAEGRRRELIAELREAAGGAVNAGLEASILRGVAYHHAGLTSEERTAVEKGFRDGRLLALCATSTLAAGVNLPAKRVIVRGMYQGLGLKASRSQYLQMVGRAGRAGQATSGESFLVCASGGHGTWRQATALLAAEMPAVCSRLLPESADEACGGEREGFFLQISVLALFLFNVLFSKSIGSCVHAFFLPRVDDKMRKQ
jgi:replicative superfamily II helicase